MIMYTIEIRVKVPTNSALHAAGKQAVKISALALRDALAAAGVNADGAVLESVHYGPNVVLEEF